MNKTKRINNKNKTRNKTLIKSKQKGGVKVHYDLKGDWHWKLYPC